MYAHGKKSVSDMGTYNFLTECARTYSTSAIDQKETFNFSHVRPHSVFKQREDRQAEIKWHVLMDEEKYTAQDECARNKNPPKNHQADAIKLQVFGKNTFEFQDLTICFEK